MLFLFLLVGVALATLPDECTQGEFEANGRFTGQNIDMNYDETALLTESGATKLRVQFFVPRRYVEQYQNNAFAITFHRDLESTVPTDAGDYTDQLNEYVDEATDDQKACYTNFEDDDGNSYGYCDMDAKAEGDPEWTIATNADNACMSDASVTVNWEDVMDEAFGSPEAKDNGNALEIFLTATVETWTAFTEGDTEQYEGQMTGAEEWLNKEDDENDTNRKGRYGGDGGWRGVGDPHSGDFGPIIIGDERYTLYQIPFILRFPRTVQVSANFRVTAPVTTLVGNIGQDVINVNLNGGPAAHLETVLTTSVQYPYGVRGPSGDDPAKMTVVAAGDGAHAASVEFVEYSDNKACGDNQLGDTCDQSFKIRIVPADATPCTVAGDYTFEFWVECVNVGEAQLDGGCTLDDLVGAADVESRRQSNAYMTQTIKINHQPFCPVLVDEVRVVGDFRVYHDESFATEIDSTSVFTNDILFYEAEYRTASAKGNDNFNGFDANDFDSAVGNDDIIDFVRATKVFMDVTIGKTSGGDATDGFNTDDMDSNFDFTGNTASGNALGATRIPDTDITSDSLTRNDSADAVKYNIVLCDVANTPAANIVTDASALTNCFSEPDAQSDIALDYLDFDQVQQSLDGASNTIDENEIGFKMRMDERIIPLKPAATDGSFVTVTIEAEVYYKGNRNPTRRRLLQAGRKNERRQRHSMNTSYAVYARETLAKCNVGDDQTEGHLELHLVYENAEDMPEVSASLDWATSLTAGMNDFLGYDRAVSVGKVSRCDENGNCRAIYMETRQPLRRRLDDVAYLKVELNVASTSKQTAGHILNRMQDHMINRRSPMHTEVKVLAKATVSRMVVPNCGEQLEAPVGAQRDGRENYIRSQEPRLDEESSAAAASTLVAALVSLMALRL